MSRVVPVGITLLLGLTGCPAPCVETTYNFAVTASLLPDKDSVKLGDTLLLRSSFPSQLRDLRSNQVVDYTNASAIGTTLYIDELMPKADSTDSFLRSAIANFSYISERGQIYTDQSVPSPKRIKQLRYQQVGGRYELATALIPSKKGLYSLSVTDGISNSKRGEDCSRAAFQMSVLSNKRSLPYLGVALKRPLTRIDSSRFYVFRVY